MSLASLTQAAHQNAERQEFAREMMSGKMSEEKYKTYLYNMWLVYDILEDVALSMGCFGPEDLSMPDDDLPKCMISKIISMHPRSLIIIQYNLMLYFILVL